MKSFLRQEWSKYTAYFWGVTAVLSFLYMGVLALGEKTLVEKNANLWIVYTGLIALAFVNPVVVYAFKTSRRGADAYYALPLSGKRLFGAKTLIGLFLTLAPFTVAYFGGALVSLCRMHGVYRMDWYVIGYPCFALLGACLFGMNAFAFTRANRLIDGVLFMFAYALLGTLLVAYFERVTHTVAYWWLSESFSAIDAIRVSGGFIENRILGGEQSKWTWLLLLYPSFTGSVGYASLLGFSEKECSERVGTASDSWLGYRLLIPLYTAFGIGVLPFTWLGFALIVCAATGITVLYRRKILFSWKYWLMIAVGVGLGVSLMLLVGVFAPPPVNPPNVS